MTSAASKVWQVETPSPVSGERDFCSQEGAHALKAMIETYWRARGHDVMVMLENVGFHPAIRAARYDLRSNMINGMPRGAGPARPRATNAPAAYGDDTDGL